MGGNAADKKACKFNLAITLQSHLCYWFI